MTDGVWSFLIFARVLRWCFVDHFTICWLWIIGPFLWRRRLHAIVWEGEASLSNVLVYISTYYFSPSFPCSQSLSSFGREAWGVGEGHLHFLQLLRAITWNVSIWFSLFGVIALKAETSCLYHFWNAWSYLHPLFQACIPSILHIIVAPSCMEGVHNARWLVNASTSACEQKNGVVPCTHQASCVRSVPSDFQALLFVK